MAHGTTTWSEPFVLKFDTSRTGIPLGNNFNDKESLTADPTDPSGNLVYAVWDRFVSPNENAPARVRARARFPRPSWFARTTNGAAATPSWEPARPISIPAPRPDDLQPDRRPPGRDLIDGFLFQIAPGAPAASARGHPLDRQGRRVGRSGRSVSPARRSARPTRSRSTAGRSSPATRRARSCAPTA